MAVVNTIPTARRVTGLTLAGLPWSRASILARMTTSETSPVDSITQSDASDTLDPGNTRNAITAFANYPSAASPFPLVNLASHLVGATNGIRVADGVVGLTGNVGGFRLPLETVNGRDAITLLAVFKPHQMSATQALLSLGAGAATSAMLELSLDTASQFRLIARHSLTTETAAVVTRSGAAPETWMGCIATVDYVGGSVRLITLTPGETVEETDASMIAFGASAGSPCSMPANSGLAVLGRSSGNTIFPALYWRGGFHMFEASDGVMASDQIALAKRALLSRINRLNAA